MAKLNPAKIQDVSSFDELIEYLRNELQWHIQEGTEDDLTFDWETDAIKIAGGGPAALAGGRVRQLRSMIQTQQWGIFIVEFARDQIYKGVLRQVLRGLVANRRSNPDLPGWKHDNLLFICATTGYQHITFAHFRGEKAARARLATFGWERGNTFLRTLCVNNLPHLRWLDAPANIEEWQKQWTAAFDKEPLTDVFFKRFQDALEKIKGELEKYDRIASGEAYTDAQLLLERLLFLYFLQNRGWLDQSHDYLIK